MSQIHPAGLGQQRKHNLWAAGRKDRTRVNVLQPPAWADSDFDGFGGVGWIHNFARGAPTIRGKPMESIG
jgi:hypothetical protein